MHHQRLGWGSIVAWASAVFLYFDMAPTQDAKNISMAILISAACICFALNERHKN